MEDRFFFVKEVFKSIQGEGFWSGRTAVFCRFSGCNLWGGTEQSREYAICKFCDTNFYGVNGQNGGRYLEDELVTVIEKVWGENKQNAFLVLTGGEPSLQVTKTLCDKLKIAGFYVAIETNGTRKLEFEPDWVCVSPKSGSCQIVTTGDELKVVHPQFEDLSVFESMQFTHRFIQPMDGDAIEKNRQLSVRFVEENPQWRLSLQYQKILKIR